MTQEILSGKTIITVSGVPPMAYIEKLFPYTEEGETLTTANIIQELAKEKVNLFDEEVINFYLNYALMKQEVLENILIASPKPPVWKGAEQLEFLFPTENIFTDVVHSTLNNFFLEQEHNNEVEPPFKLCFVHQEDQIIHKKIAPESINGTSIYGETIKASRGHSIDYIAGENIYFNETKQSFFAGACGYLKIKDNVISIIPPFRLTKDKMKLFYLNFHKNNPKDYPIEAETYEFFKKSKIDFANFNKDAFNALTPNENLLIAEGQLPGKSEDATIEIKFEIEKSIGTIDSHDKIDYKEKNTYINVDEDKLLAIKKIPVRGKDGMNLLGVLVQAPLPKDKILQMGAGTKKVMDENIMKIFSAVDGILEFKKNVISVSPKVIIPGDVGLSTGNIRTKANVEITGKVSAGFTVESEKNIIIKGHIEDNVQLTAKGDITIRSGINGQSTKIKCNGDFKAKFVESCNIYCKGSMYIQRFIREGHIECLGNMFIFGEGIDLNERGAIIDSDIKLKGVLTTPAVGSDASLTNTIRFGYDNALFNKINNLHKTIDKIMHAIQELKEQFDYDITSPNIYNEIKNIARSIKDEIIEAIQEKNKLTNKLAMMQKILDKELEKEKRIIEESNIQISKKIFPPLILKINHLRKTIDTLEPPSKFYFDKTTRIIERSPYM